MKSVFTKSATGRRAAAGTVLAMTAATLSLGLAGPASAANDVELQGHVSGAGGVALVGAYVEVDDAVTGDYVDDTVTDASGNYSFNGLSAGAVKVYFEADDSASSPLTLTSPLPHQIRWSGGSRYFQGASVTNITVDPASPATVSVNLPLYASIAGNVTVGDGHVATDGWGAWAVDSDDDYAVVDEFTDNATGNYRMLVDPSSAVRVGAGGEDVTVDYLSEFWKNADNLTSATPIVVSPGSMVTGINYRLTNALRARQAPSIAGYPTVGRALVANPGSWSRSAGTEFSYAWMRGGVLVGTGATYTPTAADFNQKLTVVVTALNGEFSGQAATATSDVVKYPATVKGGAKAQSGRKVRFGLKLVSAKQSPVKGKVVVLRGTKVVHKAVKLVKGKAVIVLKHQPKGKQTYTVHYKGNSTLAQVDKTFTVRVHS